MIAIWGRIMRRLIIAAAALTAVLSFSATKLEAGGTATPLVHAAPAAGHVGALPWALMACPAFIVFTGAVANFKDNRQLTYWEAWTCGLAYWFWMPSQVRTNSHR
jgi:hypothetical protein